MLISVDEGDFIKIDEAIASLETGKAAVDIKSTVTGRIVKFHAKVGDTVLVGNDFAIIDETQSAGSAAAKPTAAPTPAPQQAKPIQEPIKKEKPAPIVEEKKAAPIAKEPYQPLPIKVPSMAERKGTRETRRLPLSKLRQVAAQRLKEAQNTLAMLTTFNECDMSALTSLRKELGEEFLKAHGARLGFMSAFVRASVMSLEKFPAINASIEGKEVVYHDYADISVAVSSPKGLVVPVLRNCEKMSMADIEMVYIESIVCR